jgi:hypothetical protein
VPSEGVCWLRIELFGPIGWSTKPPPLDGVDDPRCARGVAAVVVRSMRVWRRCWVRGTIVTDDLGAAEQSPDVSEPPQKMNARCADAPPVVTRPSAAIAAKAVDFTSASLVCAKTPPSAVGCDLRERRTSCPVGPVACVAAGRESVYARAGPSIEAAVAR